MKGFFSKKETESISRPDGKRYSCISCGLYKDAESPKMKPFGNFKKGILCIGEAPGEVEDQKGKQWQGKTGRLLQHTFKEFGIDLFEDCLNINSVNCRPKDNRTPTNYEIDCCRSVIVDRLIKKYKPKMIILLGSSAVYSFLGKRWKKDLKGITLWRGWQIPDQDYNCWVCPVFHPSYVERSEKEVLTVWKNDLESAFAMLDKPFRKFDKPEIKIIKDLSVLNFSPASITAFDFETTGLKPHAPGHKIVCCAIAKNANLAYVFMMPKLKSNKAIFKGYLRNPTIAKIAQNMKYEDTWSKVILKATVKGWEWDTMLAAHILDNRTGATGLKFLAYVHFGIIDYSSEIAPYLRSVDGTANGLNRIMELIAKPGGKEKLMHYCGMDAIIEYRLAMLQMEIMKYEFDYLPF